MKKIIEVKVSKLAGANTYIASLELPPNVMFTSVTYEEFHGEDLREVWDKVTFRLLDFETSIDKADIS